MCNRGVLLEREKASNRELVAQLIEMEARVSGMPVVSLKPYRGQLIIV